MKMHSKGVEMKNISKERMTFSWRKINHYDVKM
jgi:hypothetical protein